MSFFNIDELRKSASFRLVNNYFINQFKYSEHFYDYSTGIPGETYDTLQWFKPILEDVIEALSFVYWCNLVDHSDPLIETRARIGDQIRFIPAWYDDVNMYEKYWEPMLKTVGFEDKDKRELAFDSFVIYYLSNLGMTDTRLFTRATLLKLYKIYTEKDHRFDNSNPDIIFKYLVSHKKNFGRFSEYEDYIKKILR